MGKFVRDDILLPKLPVFINSEMPLNDEKLQKLVDLIEEDLIIRKAQEIQSSRAIDEMVAEAEKLGLYKGED